MTAPGQRGYTLRHAGGASKGLTRSTDLHAGRAAGGRPAPGRRPASRGDPIGNLRDVTLRALEALAAADVIACEDTRVTRKLLDHYGIATPLTPYHEHNAVAARPKLLARIAAGEAVALVSDARHAAHFRSGFQASPRGAPAWHRGDGDARRVGGAGGAHGGGPADRPVFLRGFPAGEGRPAPGAHRRACSRAGDADHLREWATIGPRAGRSGGRSWLARGGGVPRTDQAARGGAARRSRGFGEDVRL